MAEHSAPRTGTSKREAGLAAARAWHIANKAYFDALYGAPRCGCGGHV